MQSPVTPGRSLEQPPIPLLADDLGGPSGPPSLGGDEVIAVVPVVKQGRTAVRPGQQVRLRLPAMTSSVAQGTVDEVAGRELEAVPRALVLSGRLPVRLDASGAARPVRTVYEVRVAVAGGTIPAGCVGEARIEAGSMSLLRRLVRFCEITFAAGP